MERCRETELTAFYKYNQSIPEDERANQPKYVDMPKTHVYDPKQKVWCIRKQKSNTIGRIHSVHPVAGDLFYKRILLHQDHCRGKTSFADMLRVGDRICETYKAVCQHLGLLEDDGEWQKILEDAALSRMCPQIRELYIMILTFCMPADPRALYDEFWVTWIDDFERQAFRNRTELTERQKQTLLLLDLEMRLQGFEKQLGDFGLPVPSQDDLAQVHHITSTEPAVI